jgi:hypothetical protein
VEVEMEMEVEVWKEILKTFTLTVVQGLELEEILKPFTTKMVEVEGMKEVPESFALKEMLDLTVMVESCTPKEEVGTMKVLVETYTLMEDIVEQEGTMMVVHEICTLKEEKMISPCVTFLLFRIPMRDRGVILDRHHLFQNAAMALTTAVVSMGNMYTAMTMNFHLTGEVQMTFHRYHLSLLQR